jgi:hypothetical protein
MKANLFAALFAIGMCTSPIAVAQQDPQPQMPVCTPPACQPPALLHAGFAGRQGRPDKRACAQAGAVWSHGE